MESSNAVFIHFPQITAGNCKYLSPFSHLIYLMTYINVIVASTYRFFVSLKQPFLIPL